MSETNTLTEPVITVTEHARAKILELRAGEENPDELGLRIEVTGVRGAVPVSITKVTAKWTGGLPGAGRQSCGASRGITKLPPVGIFITGMPLT